MFRLNEELAVYVHRDPIDFRKNINGLAALVEQGLGRDPFAPAVYVFRNRRRDRIKILGWHKNGFWLLLKRLEADRFVWPRADETVVNLSVEHPESLLGKALHYLPGVVFHAISSGGFHVISRAGCALIPQ